MLSSQKSSFNTMILYKTIMTNKKLEYNNYFLNTKHTILYFMKSKYNLTTSDVSSICFWRCFSRVSFLLCGMCHEWILVFTVLSVGFPYSTNVVQLLCSLSGWFQLNCSSIGTGFNGMLQINRNCFAIYFQQHSSYVCLKIV